MARGWQVSKLLDAAKWYARQGWPVLACRGRAPLTPHGYQDATTDAATLAKWWGQWPDANVGIATGAAGLVVVDVDTHDGAPGLDSWRDLRGELGLDGETVTCETPIGGLHVYDRGNGRQVRCSAGKLGHGLDVKANGGYVLAPPSVHPDGGTYGWAMGYGPHEHALAALAASPPPPNPWPPASPRASAMPPWQAWRVPCGGVALTRRQSRRRC